jgi:hypothetical protein
MNAVPDICACAERQERASTVCAFGLAPSEALVTDEHALLVPNEATKRIALEGPVYDTRDYRKPRSSTRDVEGQIPVCRKVLKSRVPFEY